MCLILKLAPGFVAVFNSDLNSYYYSQGIVHVSSFGFGGTNAHAIFWGEDTVSAAVQNERHAQKQAKTPITLEHNDVPPMISIYIYYVQSFI